MHHSKSLHWEMWPPSWHFCLTLQSTSVLQSGLGTKKRVIIAVIVVVQSCPPDVIQHGHWFQCSINETNETINQTNNRSINQTNKQTNNRSLNQSVNQSINQSINQWINQSSSRSMHQGVVGIGDQQFEIHGCPCWYMSWNDDCATTFSKKNSDQNAGWLVERIQLSRIVINHFRRIPINQSMEWNVNQGFWTLFTCCFIGMWDQDYFQTFVREHVYQLRTKHQILWLATISSKTKFFQSWFQFRISKEGPFPAIFVVVITKELQHCMARAQMTSICLKFNPSKQGFFQPKQRVIWVPGRLIHDLFPSPSLG